MNIRSGIVWGIAATLLSIGPYAWGGGLTVITHGLAGNADGWVTGMAEQIPNYSTFPGSAYTLYKIYYYYNGSSYIPTWTRLAGNAPSSTDSGEIIVAFDWRQLADGNSFNTYQIAGSLASILQNPNFIAELNGHALCELPTHLIGHSRGGSVMSEVSLRLGTNGIWVDHLTTLDPHPLNNDGFDLDILLYSAVDAPVRTYENVLFHDNYWENIGLLVYGESVFGAYVRQLYDLSGGYQNPHSNTHLWYHATVDMRNPADDTEAEVTSTEFSNWYFPYEDTGLNTGFRWTRIGGGNRTSTDQPLGPGYPAIRDGYNQTWDLGAGQVSSANRTGLPAHNGSWPNIMRFDVWGANTVAVGSTVSNKYFFQYGTSSSQNATVQIYLDTNSNPYDGDAGQIFQITEPGTGVNIVRSRTISASTTDKPPGQYYMYAKVTDGTHTRYLYSPAKLTIIDLTKPTVSLTNPPAAKTYTNSQTLTIAASATDNVGVTKVEFYDGATLKGTDTTLPYSYDWSFTVADNGTHSWTARVYDAAQNVSTSAVVALTISIDASPPIVVVTEPNNGTNLTSATTTVSGTASDPSSPSSGLSTVEVRVNGGAWQTASGTTSWSRSVTLTPCPNTIEARSRDKAGNYSAIASNFVTYIPPNTAPATPTNVSPANAAKNLTVTPVLQANAFRDLDCVGDTHAASQWQVLTSANKVVADSGTDTVHLVRWPVQAAKLSYGSNYLWHVRYRDSRNAWSSYSTNTTFITGGPQLTATKIGTNMVFRWPTNTPGFKLQWSTNLGSAAYWSNATPAAVIVSGNYAVTNNMTNMFRAYRLKK